MTLEKKMTDYRNEKDSIGQIKVPKQKFWGAQTQRSLQFSYWEVAIFI